MEVRTANLRTYPLNQLKGRLAYYAREAQREASERLRRECKVEADRTRFEIRRREMTAEREIKFVPLQTARVRCGPQQSHNDNEWNDAA